MGKWNTRLDIWRLARDARRSVRIKRANWISFAFGVAAAAIPVLRDFDKMPDQLVILNFSVATIWVWLLVFLAAPAIRWGAEGSRFAQWQQSTQELSTRLAGNINEIGGLLVRKLDPSAEVTAPDRIEAGLLQGIADIATGLTGHARGVKIHAAILIPELDEEAPGKPCVALKTKNYNALSGSRGFSRIPLEKGGPGPQAYLERRPAVVPDTAEAPYAEIFRNKPYRSVAAFPVTLRGLNGEIVAIVSLDATEANLFTEELIARKGLDDQIAPYLRLLAVMQISERIGGKKWRKPRT